MHAVPVGREWGVRCTLYIHFNCAWRCTATHTHTPNTRVSGPECACRVGGCGGWGGGGGGETLRVMTTKEDVRASVEGFKRGTLPSVRAPWDYKRISAFPQAPNKQ